ncbi:MAG: ribulose-phosphate 3-epimerase [Candidatus Omnitrophica bacterium]|nr:ribulose-phosphate 3-epimerase [Candidatus Omnitrophota bacterium]
MKQRKILIAPSILAADFSRLENEVKTIERGRADLVHVDVMDGHFVPNISIGPAVVASLKKRTSLPLDVHLMIDDPWFFLDAFIAAGSAVITVHVEVCSLAMLKKIRKKLREHKVRFGVSLNPHTPLKKLWPIMDFADMILIMSVQPGFGGQEFIPGVLPKISSVRKKFSGDIEVDGGITSTTAPLVLAHGANILVAGSYVFRAADRKKAIASLRLCKK